MNVMWVFHTDDVNSKITFKTVITFDKFDKLSPFVVHENIFEGGSYVIINLEFYIKKN